MLFQKGRADLMKSKKAMVLLALLGVLVLVAVGCGRRGRDQGEVIVLSYANFPPNSTFPCVQMERWKTEVEKRTGGRVQIKTYPGGTLLGAKDIFDGVVAGAADIGNFAMSYQPGRFPVSEALDLPHFFPDAQTAGKILSDLVSSTSPAEFAEVKVLSLFTCPPGVVMSSQPLSGLESLKGMALRSSGTVLEAMRLLGAAPVAMPQSDVPDALQKGVVKGLVSSAEVLKDMNYAAYCGHVMAMRLPVTSFAVVMNKARYDALPEDIQAVLDGLFAEQSAWTGDYVDQHAEEALAWARTTHNVEVTEPAAADFDRLRELFAPLFDDYVQRVQAKGVDGRKVLDFIQSHPALRRAAP